LYVKSPTAFLSHPISNDDERSPSGKPKFARSRLACLAPLVNMPGVTAHEIAALTAAATAAGAVNAIAGGGTLITFPVLLFFGTPPVIANATSTFALVFGTAGSLYGYREHIAEVKPWLWRFLPVCLLGGFLGAFLLTRTTNETFARLVPYLILFATLLFLAQGTFSRLARYEARHTPPRGALWTALVFQLGVAIYGGFFGAGIGILMLASLGFLGLTHIHQMNSLKTLLGSSINLVAALWFIACGFVNWPRAILMTAGALVGYYLGAHFAQRIPQRHVRRLITAVGLTISAVLFYQQMR
jgi:uncharacterized membrane protein YfcA